jgi:hypothetical protein
VKRLLDETSDDESPLIHLPTTLPLPLDLQTTLPLPLDLQTTLPLPLDLQTTPPPQSKSLFKSKKPKENLASDNIVVFKSVFSPPRTRGREKKIYQLWLMTCHMKLPQNQLKNQIINNLFFLINIFYFFYVH